MNGLRNQGDQESTTAAPAWVEHVLWWQVYPLGFVGAERQAPNPSAAAPDQATGPQTGLPAVGHRLPRLLNWLDYAVELGASGIALGPVFASETHGYDTTDYFRIDPRLGDDSDFDALIAAAHDRGLRVLLDGVFNNVGRSFPAFQRVLAEGPAAETAPWFRITWPSGEQPGEWQPGTEPDHADFEGHHHLVALNHGEPQVADLVIRVMKHWLGRGADGWRLDAAYAVPPDFWATVLPAVRAEFPQAYFVGEYIHGDYPAAVREGRLDSATQYELWKAIWSSLNDANFYELSAALDRHNSFLEAFAPLTFVGNHDVTRLGSRLTNKALIPHALAVLFTVGGTPSVYSGDEQAFRGVKEDRAGGDDAIRPQFPDSPDDLYEGGWYTYDLHRQLIGVRRRHAWLHRARTRVLVLANEHLVYEARADGQALMVALNVANNPVTVDVPGGGILAGEGTLDGPRLTLNPYGWAVVGA